MVIHWLLRDADDDATPQGGASGGDGKTRPSDVLDRYGRDAIRLAEKLAEAQSDNYTLREKNRVLRQERDALKAQAPADGSRVLTEAEAKAYDAYVALGTPDALKQTVEAAKTASAELGTLKRDAAIRQAAEAHGYKASVLKLALGDIDVQTRTGADNKPQAVVIANGAETPLPDYAASNWADLLPALSQTAQPQMYDINAGARSNGDAPLITDAERAQATARYRATF